MWRLPHLILLLIFLRWTSRGILGKEFTSLPYFEDVTREELAADIPEWDTWHPYLQEYLYNRVNGNLGLQEFLHISYVEPQVSFNHSRSPTMAPTSGPSKNLPPSQIAALKDFYDALNGPNWRWDKITANGTIWNFTQPDPNPCQQEWQGVFCGCRDESTCNIFELRLPYYRLNGTLPSSIDRLGPKVQFLMLQGNNISGTLPPALANLTLLSTLQVSGNQLTGTVPIEILQMKDLNFLGIAINNLHGTIDCSALPKLQFLAIYANNFVGNPLSHLLNLKDLLSLEMGNNQFSGTIPGGLGNLFRLFFIDLGYNGYHGSIPSEIGSLNRVIRFYLGNNSITGEIPPALGNMTGTVEFSLGGNFLYHTIPAELTGMRRLRNLILSNNLLTGEFPSHFNHTNLYNIQLQNNSLSGNLTSLEDYLTLVYLDTAHNEFTGALPGAHWPLMTSFLTNDNYFTGSYHCDAAQLVSVNISNNQLTGDLTYLVMNTNVRFFSTNTNFMLGTLPETIANCVDLVELQLSNNFFDGTLPSSVGNLTSLTQIVLQGNRFIGTIPRSFHQLMNLQIFFVGDNQFHGPVRDLFDWSRQTSLENLDISSNRFTGPLSASMFPPNVSFRSFAASANCITGSIPNSICHAEFLTGLAIDGLSSNTYCTHRLFPFSRLFDAFILDDYISGSIPSCLFRLPELLSLHVAGNALIGSLPADLEIADALTDVDLSYNIFSGDIPSSFQRKTWRNLDLSNNKFTGTLASDFAVQTINATRISMTTNRLSGVLPASLLSVTDISVLNGNLFSCNAFRTDLPDHDPDADTYTCGSDVVNRSFFVYVALTFFPWMIICLWVYIIRRRRKRLQDQQPLQRLRPSEAEITSEVSAAQRMHALPSGNNRDSALQPDAPDTASSVRPSSSSIATPSFSRPTAASMSSRTTVSTSLQHSISFVMIAGNAMTCGETLRVMRSTLAIWRNRMLLDNVGPLLYFQRFCRNVRLLVLVLTAVCVFVFIPIFVSMTHVTNVYRHEYAWAVSGALLSGKGPAIALYFAFVSILVLLFYLFEVKVFRVYREWRDIHSKALPQMTTANILCNILATLVNFLCMSGVDIVYVLFVLRSNATEILVVQVLLACFKLMWNEIVLWGKFPLVRRMVGQILRLSGRVDWALSVESMRLNESDVPFLVFIVLLNNVLLPCMAIAVVETNCFYNALFAAPTVYTTYQYNTCTRDITTLITDRSKCIDEALVTAELSYNPPFLYSYQCASTLIINYIPVYVYYFAMVGVVIPSMKMALRVFYAQFTTPGSPWRAFLENHGMPHILRAPQAEELPTHIVLLNKLRLVVKINSYLALFLTFGVVFPPLACVACLAIIAVTCLEEFSVGRMLHDASKLNITWYHRRLEIECTDIALCFFDTIWLITPFSSLIYGYLFFDTLGDSDGWSVALAPALVLCFFPLLLWGIIALLRILWPSTGTRLPSPKSTEQVMIPTANQPDPNHLVEMQARPTRNQPREDVNRDTDVDKDREERATRSTQCTDDDMINSFNHSNSNHNGDSLSFTMTNPLHLLAAQQQLQRSSSMSS